MSVAVAATRTTVTSLKPANGFFEKLSRASERVLLLDYDGTIAPFSPERHRAFPYPTIPELLDSIMSTCRTRVMLISGRSAKDIPPLLGLQPAPEIWGSYGVERLTADGCYFGEHVSEQAEAALARAEIGLSEAGLADTIELKPAAIAVHWRGFSPTRMEQTKAIAYAVLSPLAIQRHLLLTEFEGGLELREPICSKADVVSWVLSQHKVGTPVAYLGDDASDEDAFRVLNGKGLTVLVRPTYRFTAAQAWLCPPDDLAQFLSDWIRACGGEM
jgi:trehalose 6-phosphate phosphatase